MEMVLHEPATALSSRQSRSGVVRIPHNRVSKSIRVFWRNTQAAPRLVHQMPSVASIVDGCDRWFSRCHDCEQLARNGFGGEPFSKRNQTNIRTPIHVRVILVR